MGIKTLCRSSVEVEITSADPEQLLDSLRCSNLDIRNIQKQSDLVFSAVVPKHQFYILEERCQKQGSSYKIRKKIGLYWFGSIIFSRPILLIGGFTLFFLMLWLPSRVFYIRVEGNTNIPSKRILEAAEYCGITFGASRREIRSERIKNALLEELPQLQWAGINTSGCTAVIAVREKEDIQVENNTDLPSDICASRDGYIISATATSGNLMVKPGESVKEGQTLISGYTDCDICIRAESAEGEIIAQTIRNLEVKTPSTKLIKGDVRDIKKRYSLLVRKKRIFLWKDSGIWDSSCGRMYEEYYITLPGRFRLPIALCVESYSVGQCLPTEISYEEANAALNEFSDLYLQQRMIAGKIRSKKASIESNEGCYTLAGNYICEEMIGTIRQKQIGDRNGKND